MLSAGNGQAVARNDDHGLGVGEHEGGVIGRARLDGLLFAPGRGGCRLAPKAAQDHVKKGPVHRLTHDVGEDRAA